MRQKELEVQIEKLTKAVERLSQLLRGRIVVDANEYAQTVRHLAMLELKRTRQSRRLMKIAEAVRSVGERSRKPAE